jgi:hypothetical protein
MIAELVNKPRRKPRALPVVATALALSMTCIIAEVLATTVHPLMAVLFPVALVGVLIWFVAYDFLRWFRSP